MYRYCKIIFTRFDEFKPEKAKLKLEVWSEQLPAKLKALNIQISPPFFVFDYEEADGNLKPLTSFILASPTKHKPDILNLISQNLSLDYRLPASSLQLLSELGLVL